MEPLWGIDLGGTKIEGVILSSSENPEVIARLRVSTEKEKGYEHIIQQIGVLIGMLEKESGLSPQKLGMGTPGALDPVTQTLKNSNTTIMNGKPFKKDLEAALGIPVSLANDANCFAIAEARMGIVKDVMPEARMVFGVIMGSGVGGGLVIDGQVWNGRMGIGGEWGHSYLDPSGGMCYCGQIGCVETIFSGPALESYYTNLSGQTLKLRDITERHLNKTDPHATQTIERMIHFFGRGIANLINILDPDCIVLGGGVGNIDLLYTEGKEAVKKFIFNPRLETLLLKPKLGDSAGVFGAAFLVA
jgi:predicted NBD/HSP70 family sugar kinase